MMTSSARPEASHIGYLDGWRGIAILLVLADHFFGLPTGYVGVALFFALSGRLMSDILFVRRMPLRTFYRRRVARILPLFWLYVVTTFIFGAVVFREFHWTSFLATMVFLRTYWPARNIFTSYIPIGHLWTLNIEEHCYLFLSLIALAVASRRKALTMLLAASALCLTLFLAYKLLHFRPASPYLLRSEVAAFPLVIAAAAYLFTVVRPIRVRPLVPVAALTFTVGASFLVSSYFFFYFVGSVLLALSVVTLPQAPAWFLHLLSSRLLRWFGVCSYSIYMWQQIFWFSGRFFKEYHEFYRYIAIAVTLGISAASFYFYESPLRAWLSGKPRCNLDGTSRVVGNAPTTA